MSESVQSGNIGATPLSLFKQSLHGKTTITREKETIVCVFPCFPCFPCFFLFFFVFLCVLGGGGVISRLGQIL